jgi:hypothetical protein
MGFLEFGAVSYSFVRVLWMTPIPRANSRRQHLKQALEENGSPNARLWLAHPRLMLLIWVAVWVCTSFALYARYEVYTR